MADGKLKINSENIMPIIKKALYSDIDIFLRELVSNATDATSKLKILESRGEARLPKETKVEVEIETKEGEEAPKKSLIKESLAITISLDKENKLLTISDHGLGMTKEEVEKYITDVAFSGAAEFVEKYQSDADNGGIIGHFGLGFYSAFMVADKVEIKSLSHKEGAQAVHWTCDGSSSYKIEDIEKERVGTDVILHITEEEMLDENRLKEILKKYCSFLPHPIYFEEEKINDQEPLWMKKPADCTDEEYKAFFKKLYPMEEEPIFWVHLNVDHPFHLKGILYFPKVNPRFDFQSSSIQLYSNRVFVSNNLKDLFPDFLTVMRGAIDSSDIPLNVSRSYLQMNSTVKKLSTHIAKKLGDRLKSFASADKERFEKVWGDLETIVKLGALREEKFYDRVKDILIYKTIEGNYLTAAEYLEKHKDAYENKIFYTEEQEETNFLTMYKEKGIEVLKGGGPLDSALFNTLESKLSCHFQRIDGGISDMILDDKEKEKAKAKADTEKDNADDKKDAEAEVDEYADLTTFVKDSLGLEFVDVQAKGLTSKELPGFVMIDEGTRRMRDYFAMSQKEMPREAFSKHTFVINTNSSLVESMHKLKDSAPELSKKLVKQVYDLSLLSQKEMHPEALGDFIKRTGSVIEELALQAAKK
ncbi:MAG: Chaperone protein HtpG [Chlamydiia bacterium]|nr:Chaperone protein HtpG [Chlamydiia bacterium]